MISRAQIKQVRLLHQKKYRDELGLFIAEGPKIVNELLGSRFKVKEIFSTGDFVFKDPGKKNHSSQAFKEYQVNDKELQEISNQSSPIQVLAVVEMEKNDQALSVLPDQLVLALDDIRDPGNFGTIIRIADWFGIKHIVCSPSCVDLYNPKAVQSTMGSLARVHVDYAELATVVLIFKHVYAAVLDGANIYSEKLSSSGIILIGNEARGIATDLLKYVTGKISIPNFSEGADSLNAAVAAALVCSEFKRKNK